MNYTVCWFVAIAYTMEVLSFVCSLADSLARSLFHTHSLRVWVIFSCRRFLHAYEKRINTMKKMNMKLGQQSNCTFHLFVHFCWVDCYLFQVYRNVCVHACTIVHFFLSIFDSVHFFLMPSKRFFFFSLSLSRPFCVCLFIFLYLSHVAFVMFLLFAATLSVSFRLLVHAHWLRLTHSTFIHSNPLHTVAQYRLYSSNSFNMVSFITCVPYKLLHSGEYIYTTYHKETVNVSATMNRSAGTDTNTNTNRCI